MAQETESSFASLISGALNDVRELFRQEIALARYEVREEVNRATMAMVAIAGAAVAGVMAALFVLTAAAWAISYFLNWPAWTGFLIVGVLLAFVGGVLFVMGRSRMRALRMVPPQTAETMKENAQWLRQQTRSVRG